MDISMSGPKLLLKAILFSCVPGVINRHIKFFALRVTPPAHPGPPLAPKWRQDGAKLVSNWVQKSNKNGVPHRTWGPKMGYPIGPWDQQFENKSVQKSNATKKEGGTSQGPPC